MKIDEEFVVLFSNYDHASCNQIMNFEETNETLNQPKSKENNITLKQRKENTEKNEQHVIEIVEPCNMSFAADREEEIKNIRNMGFFYLSKICTFIFCMSFPTEEE